MLLPGLWALGAAITILLWVLAAKRLRPLGSLRNRYEEGISLSQSGRLSDAVAAFDAIIEEASGETAAGVRIVVANAMLQKGEALRDLGCTERAIQTCREISAQFGEDTGYGFPGRLQVAPAAG